MALGSLAVHLQTQHGKEAGGRRNWETTAPGRKPRTYRMALLTSGGLRNFPLKGCPGRAATRMAMRVHFFHWHVRDTVIILEEGNLPHPRCPRCDMLVTWITLNRRHLATAQCSNGSKRKHRRLVEEEQWEISERAF